MTLGARVRKARLKAGYTQETLANAVGINRVTINKLERDKEIPSVFSLFEIVKELGMKKEQEAFCTILHE